MPRQPACGFRRVLHGGSARDPFRAARAEPMIAALRVAPAEHPRTTTKEDHVQGQSSRCSPGPRAGPWREIQRELAASVPELTPTGIWFSPLTPVSRRGATLYLTGPAAHHPLGAGAATWSSSGSRLDRAAVEIREVELVTPEDASAASPAAKEAASTGRPQPRLHLRALRDRPGQPARPRRGAGGRGGAGRGLQPALPARPAGTRQDAPAGRDRQLPPPPRATAHRPLHDRRVASPTSSSPRCRAPASRPSRSATAEPTCC